MFVHNLLSYPAQGRRNIFEHGKDRYFQNGPSSLSDPGQKVSMKIKSRLTFCHFNFKLCIRMVDAKTFIFSEKSLLLTNNILIQV